MVDQLEIEKKWQAYWKEQKTFVAHPTEQPKFFGTVPYPYANSALHIGHGRMFTAADIMFRYQRLLGKNVLYPLGYHISGTPVLAVADGIANGDEKMINITREAISAYVADKKEVEEILASFTDVQVIADFFSSKIVDTFASIGLGMDFSKNFSTGDEAYQNFVQWQYRQLEEKGILTQGKYPILYSAEDENAVGEDDIKDGDTDKVSIQEMIYILFKEKDGDAYFCVATLRPDALFGTTNLWVDPSHDILKVQVGKQQWYVNKAILPKLTHQYDDVEVLAELKGQDLLDKQFITPLIDREVPVASAPFIDPRHGTGLVYSSPAGSPHDYMGLVEAREDGRLPKDIQVIATVQSKDKKGQVIEWDGECAADAMRKKYGVTTADDPKLEDAKQALYKIEHYSGSLTNLGAPWDGLPVKHAKDKVTEALLDADLGGILYETSRRATTRAGKEVIVANLDGQWFLDYTDKEVKAQAKKLLDSMSFYPENLRATQQGYLDWVEKRPCARKRGIGTPLPQDPEWVIEPLSDSTIYPFYYVISGMINSGKLKPEDITDALLEYFYHDGPAPIIEGVEQLKEEVAYWKNFDCRYTASAHMSNHLSFLIYHNALLFTPEYWPKNITIGGLLIKDGQKISKSKGNGLPLIQVRETYGADLYRLYVVVGTSYDSEFDFREEEIHQLEKKFGKWKELLFAARAAKELGYETFDATDKWLISRFYTRAQDYFVSMNEMKSREAYISILYEFMNEINYHTRRTSQGKTAQVLRFFFADYVKLMTPVVPHICEELLNGDASLAEFQTIAQNYIDAEAEAREGIVQELLVDIDRRLGVAQKKGDEVQTITLTVASEKRYELFDTLKELLVKDTDKKEIMSSMMKNYAESEGNFVKKFVPKTFGSGLQPYYPREEEIALAESLKPFLEKEYDLAVAIETEKEQVGKPGEFHVSIS